MKTKTVERLMNETSEHIKQQVSEYADALVNKKQSSIDWLEEQYYESEGKLTRQDFEQAKAMHKEEVMQAVYDSMGTNFDPNMGRAELYYNEKYN